MVKNGCAVAVVLVTLVAACSTSPSSTTSANSQPAVALTWVNPGGTTEWGVALPIGNSDAAVFGLGEVCTEGVEADIVSARLGDSDRVKVRIRPAARTDLFGARTGSLETLGLSRLGTSVKTVCSRATPAGDEVLVEVSIPPGVGRAFGSPLVMTYEDRRGRTGKLSIPVTLGLCRATDRCAPQG